MTEANHKIGSIDPAAAAGAARPLRSAGKCAVHGVSARGEGRSRTVATLKLPLVISGMVVLVLGALAGGPLTGLAQTPAVAPPASPPFIAGETVAFRTKQVAVFESEESPTAKPTKSSAFKAPIVTVALSMNGRRLQLRDAGGRTFWVGVWTVDRASVAPVTTDPIMGCTVQSGVRGGKGCGS